MPTPFTHLAIAQQLLHDPALPAPTRSWIQAYQPAFLLGGIVADQRVEQGAAREATHFYHYARPMPDHPWREMFRQHPSLEQPQSEAHRAFLMGYVAHLAADEFWSRYMLKPHFAEATWGKDRHDRFFVLHLLLICMDERDEATLSEAIAETLRRCVPHEWLPFLPDEKIIEWRDFLAEQLEGQSQTLKIFGGRIKREPAELRAILDDAAQMQQRLWDNVPTDTLAELEADLYAFSRQQLQIYVDEFLILSKED